MRISKAEVPGAQSAFTSLDIAPPVEGRANEAVIEFLADLFEIPRSSVTIASGATSRNKVVRLAGITRQAVEQRLLVALSKL